MCILFGILYKSPIFFYVQGFPHSSVGKESACNAGDLSLIPGSGRSCGEEIGYPLQYSWASLVAQLVRNLPSMWGTWVWSLGWEDPRRRTRLPTPVFWPREFHGLYSPWGHKELDKTEQLSLHSYVLKSLIFLLNFCLLAPSIIEIGMLVSSNNYRSVYFTFYFYQLCFVLKSCLYKGRITSLMNVSFDHYEVSLLNIMY